ncbi:MAG: CBS domain-containing protein [Melioribacteraceae bacterium]|nr:CBS domain-containing protein [Melioribacteraceae bacterium]MDD3558962.1 CBS domain-containing protein [Melioribacteraceae bacterium]
MKTAAELLQEKGNEIFSVPPDSTIYDALQLMNKNNIGAMLVEEDGNIIGIWTERDLTRNMLRDGFDIRKTKIKDVMISDLIKVPHDCTTYKMMDIFLGKRLRHLLVEKEGKFIGLLSTGDVIKANLMAKSQELEELNKIVSFEYYSNWRWKKK